MQKKTLAILITALAVIIVSAISCSYFNYWPAVAPDNPNAVLPQGEGLAVAKSDGVIVSFGVDYIAIVKENGELWVWGIDPDPPANVNQDYTSQQTGYITNDDPPGMISTKIRVFENDADQQTKGSRDYTSFKSWKLADHVVAAVPVGTDTYVQGGVFLSVLYEDASLWIWDISVMRDEYGKTTSLNIIKPPQQIMKGVSDIVGKNAPHSMSFYALKTNSSLWSVWREMVVTTFSIEVKGFRHGKTMDNVNALWVNPVDNSQTYVLKDDNTLYGFGENAQGQLGVGFSISNNKRESLNKPTKVTDSVISVITQTELTDIMSHTMAIKDDRSLWLWGWDIWFDLSSSTNPSATEGFYISNVPVKIMDNVAYAAMGANYCLVIKQDGSLWTWGYSSPWQLGIEPIKEPVKIMDNVVSITAGSAHSLALQTDGSLWAWGDNRLGQLGTGDTISRNEPVKIMENVAAIFTYVTCNAAVKQDGSVWIWGNTAFYPGSDAAEEDSILEPICILE